MFLFILFVLIEYCHLKVSSRLYYLSRFYTTFLDVVYTGLFSDPTWYLSSLHSKLLVKSAGLFDLCSDVSDVLPKGDRYPC